MRQSYGLRFVRNPADWASVCRHIFSPRLARLAHRPWLGLRFVQAPLPAQYVADSQRPGPPQSLPAWPVAAHVPVARELAVVPEHNVCAPAPAFRRWRRRRRRSSAWDVARPLLAQKAGTGAPPTTTATSAAASGQALRRATSTRAATSRGRGARATGASSRRRWSCSSSR